MYERVWNNVINDNKVNQLIRNYLIDLGYTENVVIRKYIYRAEEFDRVEYYAYDTIRYHGKDTKTMTVINCNKVMKIISGIYELNDNTVKSISPIVRGDIVDYKVLYVTNNKQYRKSM